MRKLNKRTVDTIELVLLIAIVGYMGFIAGFYDASGGLPFQGRGLSIATPTEAAMATIANVTDTIAPLQEREYREGYNCLDYAWDAMRLLQWQGQAVMLVRLDLDPDPDHAVIVVATEDNGWVFLEPQTGQQIYPRPGGRYRGIADILGVYIMDAQWVHYEVYLADVVDSFPEDATSDDSFEGNGEQSEGDS